VSPVSQTMRNTISTKSNLNVILKWSTKIYILKEPKLFKNRYQLSQY
jgi:hypothetical protein